MPSLSPRLPTASNPQKAPLFPEGPRRGFIAATCLLLGASAIAPLGLGGCKSSPDLPVLGTVPVFSLRDQDDQVVSPQSLSKTPWVAAFMFTRCPSICPRITEAMAELRQQADAAGLKVHWVSFSVDPENDTPEVLKAYARANGADVPNWSFLTGDFAAIKSTAEDGFKMALDGKATEGAPHLGISHGSHLVLVDKKQRIRGYFRTLEPEARAQLLDALRAL